MKCWRLGAPRGIGKQWLPVQLKSQASQLDNTEYILLVFATLFTVLNGSERVAGGAQEGLGTPQPHSVAQCRIQSQPVGFS